MRAYHFQRQGEIDNILVREHEIPEPGYREVLVRLHASTLNRRDIMILNGAYVWTPFVPNRVPLSDGAGIVAGIGQGVTRFKVDDAVVSTPLPRWLGGKVSTAALVEQPGATHDGMLCEYRVFHEDALVEMPGHLDFEEAASLPAAGVTAWTAVKGLKPGETLLIEGSSSVSLFALQFAAIMGIDVLMTTSDDSKIDRLKALGARAVVNYSRPDWPQVVRDLTGGRGVDRVVEMGGISTLGQSIRCTAFGGHIAVVGSLAGPGSLDGAAFSANIVSIHRVSVGSREDMENMNRAIALQQLKPVLDTTFGFQDAKTAFHRFATGQYFGKIAIRHDG